MSILHIFNRRKQSPTTDRILQANATLYPDKILIDTTDIVKEGFGISSTNITMLPVDADAEVIGSTIRHHLTLTRTDLNIPRDYKQRYNDFLKKAGFKNGSEHHRNALMLGISQRDNEIQISPTRNRGYTGKDRGFLAIKNADINVTADTDNRTLGEKVKFGWTKCECNCI